MSVEDVYRFDPAPAALTEEQREHILGVQANLWTEHIRTEDRVEYMTFPRAAALAEVAWSPAERIDWQSFAARLPEQLARYRALGVGFAQRAASRSPSGPDVARSHELEHRAARRSCCRWRTMRPCRASAPCSWSTS